jgi:hypothetical protein
MNQYICETCTHPDENPNKCPCPLNDLKLERKIIEVGELCGLGCHSDFQNQREKLLGEIESMLIESCTEDYKPSGMGCKCCPFLIVYDEGLQCALKELRGEHICSKCGRPLDSRCKCHECLNNQFLDEEYAAYQGDRE